MEKLAKVGLAKVGQALNWQKSVKELAKVGLTKVGWAKSAMTDYLLEKDGPLLSSSSQEFGTLYSRIET